MMAASYSPGAAISEGTHDTVRDFAPSADGLGNRSVAQSRRSAHVTYSIATSARMVEELELPWRALEARAASPVFFQSWAWSCHLLRTAKAYGGNKPIEICVVTAWDGPELVAVWPLQMRKALGARILSPLGDPFNQYADVVLDRAWLASGSEILASMLDCARRVCRPDGMSLRKVRTDGPLCGFLQERGARAIPQSCQIAPFVSLGGYVRFADYLATVRAKTRKNIRNSRNRLERLGALTHHVERRAADMSIALERCLELRLDWLDQRGLTSTAFASSGFLPMLKGLARTAEHDIDLISMTLMLGDEVLSVHFGFVHAGRYYAYMAARNPKFDDGSPGKLHMEYVLRACHEQGIEIADFLAPAMPYKLTWTSEAVAIEDYALPFTLKGRLALDVGQGMIRPLAKRVFMRLPGSWRRLAVPRAVSRSAAD